MRAAIEHGCARTQAMLRQKRHFRRNFGRVAVVPAFCCRIQDPQVKLAPRPRPAHLASPKTRGRPTIRRHSDLVRDGRWKRQFGSAPETHTCWYRCRIGRKPPQASRAGIGAIIVFMIGCNLPFLHALRRCRQVRGSAMGSDLTRWKGLQGFW